MIGVILGILTVLIYYFWDDIKKFIQPYLQRYVKQKPQPKQVPQPTKKQLIIKKVRDFYPAEKPDETIAQLQAEIDSLRLLLDRYSTISKQYLKVTPQLQLKLQQARFIFDLLFGPGRENNIIQYFERPVKVLYADDKVAGVSTALILTKDMYAYLLVKDNKGHYFLIPDPTKGIQLKLEQLIANPKTFADQIRNGVLRVTITSSGEYKPELYVPV